MSIVAGTFLGVTSGQFQVVEHNLGFTPVAIIALASGTALTERVNVNESMFSMGFATADGSHRCAGTRATNNQSTTGHSYRVVSDDLLHMPNASGGTSLRARIAGWSDTDFTIEWVSNPPLGERRVSYILVGGPGIDATVASWTSSTSATTTVSGIGFYPELLIDIHAGGYTASNGNPSTSHSFGIGVSHGSSQASMQFFGTNSTSPNQHYIQRTDRLITGVSSAGAVAKSGQITNRTNDSFTISWDVGATNNQHGTLCIRGLSDVAIVGFLNNTSTGLQILNVGFRPAAVFIAGTMGNPGTGTEITGTQSRLSVGFATADYEALHAMRARHNVDPTQTARAMLTDSILGQMNLANNTMLKEAYLAGFMNDGFALNWVNSSVTRSHAIALVIGEPTIPFTPQNIDLTRVSTTELTVSWDATSITEHYNLRYRKSGDVDFTTIPNLPVTGSSEQYAITGLDPATTYQVQVQACNIVGCSDWSSIISERTAYPTPSVPTFFHISAQSPTQIQLGWSESTYATDYQIEQSPNGSTGWTFFALRQQFGIHEFDGFDPFTTYYFRVRAENPDGVSGWSPVAVVTTHREQPQPPDDITVDSLEEPELLVGWIADPWTETVQVRHRIAGSSDPWTVSAEITGFEYTIQNLAGLTTYEVELIAINPDASSDWTSPVTATTAIAPLVNFSATATTHNRVTLTWEPPS